jgi:hypothetical protein
MAAAAIGLGVELAPVVIPVVKQIIDLIVGLTHKSAPVAEAQLGASTGPAKFGMVFGDVVAALNTAALAGQISKVLPPDGTIQMIIQAAITSMQIAGNLVTPTVATAPAVLAPAPTANAQTVTLKAGQSLTITVAE